LVHLSLLPSPYPTPSVIFFARTWSCTTQAGPAAVLILNFLGQRRRYYTQFGHDDSVQRLQHLKFKLFEHLFFYHLQSLATPRLSTQYPPSDLPVPKDSHAHASHFPPASATAPDSHSSHSQSRDHRHHQPAYLFELSNPLPHSRSPGSQSPSFNCFNSSEFDLKTPRHLSSILLSSYKHPIYN